MKVGFIGLGQMGLLANDAAVESVVYGDQGVRAIVLQAHAICARNSRT